MPTHKKLTDLVIKQAALLYSLGETQRKVMDVLDLAQPTASNAKKIAEDRGWLSRPRLQLPPEEIEQLMQLVYADGLKDKLVAAQEAGAHHLRTLRIYGVEHPASPDDVVAHGKHLDAFGLLAAQHLVDELFPQVDSVGVSWGGTLLATTRLLDRGDLSRMKRTGRQEQITFFPVCGAPPDATVHALRSSSNLVALLDEIVNDSAPNPNNFTGIVAALSHRYKDFEAKAIWKYFFNDTGFARVFGSDGDPGLIQRTDAVLTGVGSPDPQDDPWVTGAAEAAGIDPEILASSTFGNISGIFLPRPDIDSGAAQAVADVNELWTGIHLEQLLDCARRAKSSNRGGTVVIASGARKVGTVLECIRQGLVSELLIDAELAAELARELS